MTVELPQPTTREGFYKDIAFIAYPALPTEVEDNMPATITASDPTFDVQLATDKRWDKVSTIKKLVMKIRGFNSRMASLKQFPLLP